MNCGYGCHHYYYCSCLWGKLWNSQNLLPGFSHLHTDRCAAEPLGQGLEKGRPFSPPISSWCIISLTPASHQGPTNGVPPGRGEREAERAPRGQSTRGGWRRQMGPSLASGFEQVVRNQKRFLPTYPFP